MSLGVWMMAFAVAAACEVTQPNGVVAGSVGKEPLSYGNALLSTSLWPNGTIEFKPGGPGFVTRDGGLGMKFFWRKAVQGTLNVTGRRMGDAALQLRLQADNSHDTFTPSYLIFPGPGCWEVTAQVGNRADSKLTFVTKVVKTGDGPSWRPDEQ
jgi:hypothetical protein